ncbi:MAG: GntR family transcriptional regulator [Paenibacillus sp.]|jgi:GntR family transcriptional regulator|nr:GntR family transcriptional regulator [Paenibacillus sp.]
MKVGEEMNVTTDTLFKIDQQSPLPINVQIKEQIKWLIGKNLLGPGDDLPSTNQLADQLAINRNTIQSVYSQLKDEGLLTIQKGRGTRIADGDKIQEFKRRNAYFEFVEQMISESKEAGYNTEQVLLAGLAYTQLFDNTIKKPATYLFIECKKNSCHFYLEEVKRVTSAVIETIDIDAPEDELLASIRRADVIVTTLDRVDRVKSLQGVANKPVITVGDSKDVSLLLNILRP